MLFILNGAIHEVKTRYRRKDRRKRSCKYFNAFISGFFLNLKSMQLVTITKSKNIQVMLQSGFSLCESIQIDPGRENLIPYNTLTNSNCNGSLFIDFIL